MSTGLSKLMLYGLGILLAMACSGRAPKQEAVPTCAVQGVIVDTAGNPVEYGRVYLELDRGDAGQRASVDTPPGEPLPSELGPHEPDRLESSTDADGRFLFTAVEAGLYSLSCGFPERAYLRHRELAPQDTQSVPITVPGVPDVIDLGTFVAESKNDRFVRLYSAYCDTAGTGVVPPIPEGTEPFALTRSRLSDHQWKGWELPAFARSLEVPRNARAVCEWQHVKGTGRYYSSDPISGRWPVEGRRWVFDLAVVMSDGTMVRKSFAGPIPVAVNALGWDEGQLGELNEQVRVWLTAIDARDAANRTGGTNAQ
ncbi:MAG TPA: carboxypeptidase-like regulatory domain-containing protein [Thermoanaerobaculales bacterium]|nr:carboxypeptidase-like regulatory domain-containing protein [Thermoanaerobaculales bacterium]